MGAFALEPHGWLGPASEGGSNTVCREEHCGQLRLAKIHAGFAVRHSILAFSSVPGVEADRPVKRIPVAQSDIPAVAAWDAYAKMVRDLLVRKAGYGNSWQHQGYMGNIGRVLSKADRLKEMLWQDKNDALYEEDETVLDTLMDIGPLAAFAISNIEDSNRWGRDHG